LYPFWGLWGEGGIHEYHLPVLFRNYIHSFKTMDLKPYSLNTDTLYFYKNKLSFKSLNFMESYNQYEANFIDSNSMIWRRK
jgi:hypothetical protein